MDNELKLTEASAWGKRSSEGIVVELPSGFVVKLRPVSMETLLLEGRLIDPLTPIVAEIISTGGHDFKDPVQGARDMIELKRVMCTASLMYPKLVKENPNYDEGEIKYEDIPSEDTEFIMSWALRPQKELTTFRKE